jgi:hypothetical protein
MYSTVQYTVLYVTPDRGRTKDSVWAVLAYRGFVGVSPACELFVSWRTGFCRVFVIG